MVQRTALSRRRAFLSQALAAVASTSLINAGRAIADSANETSITSLQAYLSEVSIENGSNTLKLTRHSKGLDNQLYQFLKYSQFAYGLNLNEPIEIDPNGSVFFRFNGPGAYFYYDLGNKKSFDSEFNTTGLYGQGYKHINNLQLTVSYALHHTISFGDLSPISRQSASSFTQIDDIAFSENYMESMYIQYIKLLQSFDRIMRIFNIKNLQNDQRYISETMSNLDVVLSYRLEDGVGHYRAVYLHLLEYVKGCLRISNDRNMFEHIIEQTESLFDKLHMPATLFEAYKSNKIDSKVLKQHDRYSFRDFSGIDVSSPENRLIFCLRAPSATTELGSLRRAARVLGIEKQLPIVAILINKQEPKQSKVCLSFRKNSWMLMPIEELETFEVRTTPSDTHGTRLFSLPASVKGDYMSTTNKISPNFLDTFSHTNLGSYIAPAVYHGLSQVLNGEENSRIEKFEGTTEELASHFKSPVLTNAALSVPGWKTEFMKEWERREKTAMATVKKRTGFKG